MSSVPLHPNTQTAQLSCKCKVSLTPDGVFQLTSPTGATLSLNLPPDPDHPHGVESQDFSARITVRLAKLDPVSVFEVQAHSACGTCYRGSALLTNLASHDPLDVVHLTSQQQPQLPSFVGIIRHGSGHQTSSTGDIYECQWLHDKRSGSAVFRSVLHDYVYQGQYAADQWHGQGTLEFKQSGTKYVGQFLHDRMAGPGVLTSADGTVYKGQFWDGCCHGTGRADYGEGHFYEGEWIQGLREGEGTCRFPNGLTYTGNWVDNKPHASHFKLSLDTGETLQVDSKMGTVEIQEGRLVLCAAQTQPKKIMLGGATYKGTWLTWVDLGTGLFADPQLDLPACLHVLDQKRHPATVEVEFGSSVATQPDQLVCRVPVTVHRPEAEEKEAVEVASGTVSLKYRVLARKAGGPGGGGVDGRFGFHGKGELEKGGVSLYKGQGYSHTHTHAPSYVIPLIDIRIVTAKCSYSQVN